MSLLTSSVRVANELSRLGIHTTLIPDSSMGYFMHTVNLVIISRYSHR